VRRNRIHPLLPIGALVFASLLLVAIAWTDRSFMRSEALSRIRLPARPFRMHDVVWAWAVRLFVDLIAGLSVASLAIVAASLSRGREPVDRVHPAPGRIAAVLLVVTVLLSLTGGGLEWWFAPPWSPRLLYLNWLILGNHGGMALIAGWGLLIATRRYRARREDRMDQFGRWIGGCWLVGALGWWTVWSIWG
jgi:hypothetical protein